MIIPYGGFLKWWYPQIIHVNGIFHCKPSILGYPNFWKHPYMIPLNLNFWSLSGGFPPKKPILGCQKKLKKRPEYTPWNQHIASWKYSRPFASKKVHPEHLDTSTFIYKKKPVLLADSSSIQFLDWAPGGFDTALASTNFHKLPYYQSNEKGWGWFFFDTGI